MHYSPSLLYSDTLLYFYNLMQFNFNAHERYSTVSKYNHVALAVCQLPCREL